jgi:hypothetical protein
MGPAKAGQVECFERSTVNNIFSPFKFYVMKNIISYKDTRDNNLATTSQRVIEKLENNPVFPNPPAALAELKKVLPEFQAALVKAKGRDKEMVSIKNDKKAVVLTLLTELAEYVMLTSNGDRTAILSSGFDVTAERTSPTTPSIETIQVELGLPGEATTRIKNAVNAIAYVHQYATESPGPSTVWVSEGSSQRTYKFSGLTSDKRYWFRVVAIGPYGQRAYSPVVSRAIQ